MSRLSKNDNPCLAPASQMGSFGLINNACEVDKVAFRANFSLLDKHLADMDETKG